MSDFEEVIKKAKPDLKPVTFKSYLSAFKNIEKVGGSVFKPTELFKLLEEAGKSNGTIRNISNVSQIYLENKDLEKYKEEIKIYSDFKDNFMKNYVKQNESGIISDNQKPNFITKDELMDLLLKIKNDPNYNNDTDLQKAYCIYSLLVQRPLRNDLSGLILTTQSKFNKISDEEKSNNSYLIRKDFKLTLYFNQYSTTKTRPQEIAEITGNAKTVMNKFIKINKFKSDDVIFNFSKNYLSQLLIRISKKYIGKNIGSLMIRKIISSDKFLEHKQSDIFKEQEAHAKSIGHSVKMENLVYVKKKE
tara:strand:+ start:96 stop:1007 length:912 start_codon:yes stop_codon:yes gene_type:complete